MFARRKYDQEVLRRAVGLVKSFGRPVAHIAAELGIGSESLRKAAGAGSGERPDLPTMEELAEIRRLRRENEELRRTNEICPGARPGAAQRDVAVT